MSSMTTGFFKGMRLKQPFVSTEPLIGVGRSKRVSDASVSMQRRDEPFQAFSLGEAGSNPSIHHYSPMTKQSHFMPHLAQSSPSRLGQQPIQRHNLGRSAPFRGSEWSHLNVQSPQSSYHSGGPHSTGSKDMQ